MKEKTAHPETMATINIKPEYPLHQYRFSELPPPAYCKPQSSAVQVAKIVAITLVLVSFVLGSFLLASAYVIANASCRQLDLDLEFLRKVADKVEDGGQGRIQPEALIQEEPKHVKHQSSLLNAELSENAAKEITENNIDNKGSDSDSSSSAESDEAEKVKFKLPQVLNFGDLTGPLVANNKRFLNNGHISMVVFKTKSFEEKSSEDSKILQEISIRRQNQRQPVQPIPQDMMSREVYARRLLPIYIPVNMMQQKLGQESEAATAETSAENSIRLQEKSMPRQNQRQPAQPVPQDMMSRKSYDARRILPIYIPVNIMQQKLLQESEAITAETSVVYPTIVQYQAGHSIIPSSKTIIIKPQHQDDTPVDESIDKPVDLQGRFDNCLPGGV